MRAYMNEFPITAPFGSIDPAHLSPHKGVDFGVPIGTPVPSIGDGVITSVTNQGSMSFGLAVHERLDDGTDVIMGHLSKVYVHVGQHVKAGEILAASGSTGDSTGPHLHLQMMKGAIPIDPLQHVQSPSSLSFVNKYEHIWQFTQDLYQNGWFHALTGETPAQFASECIQAIGSLSLGGFLIALSLACFGLKVGRKWTIRFLAGYMILTIIGASL